MNTTPRENSLRESYLERYLPESERTRYMGLILKLNNQVITPQERKILETYVNRLEGREFVKDDEFSKLLDSREIYAFSRFASRVRNYGSDLAA